MKNKYRLLLYPLVLIFSFIVGMNCTYTHYLKGSEKLDWPKSEQEFFGNFFNHQIDFDKVTVRYSGDDNNDGRNFELNNTIFLNPANECEEHWDSPNCRSSMSHELTHVFQWQYFGPFHFPENNQIYNYEIDFSDNFLDYGIEQQAQMVADYYGWIFNDVEHYAYCLNCNEYGLELSIEMVQEKLRSINLIP